MPTAPPAVSSLAADLVRNAAEHGDDVGLFRRTTVGWHGITWAQVMDDVVRVAKGLVANRVEPGDTVAVLMRNGYEWTVVDYAIWFAGAVSVPMYPTSAPETLRWIIADSGARVLVTDADPVGSAVEAGATTRVVDVGAGLGALQEAGADIPDDDIAARRLARTGEHVATVLYTSGTTGRPKGCTITHANLDAEASSLSVLPELFAGPDAATLIVLPLAHVFARILQIGAVRARIRLGCCADVTGLVDDLQTFRPTFVFTVPRLLERLFAIASQRATAEGRGRVFDTAARVAVAVSRRGGPERSGLRLRTRHRLADRAAYQPVRDLLGGRLVSIVSGGAPLGDRLAHFFHGIGIEVLEGYGLTETTGAVTVGTPSTARIGSVGRALPGTTLLVAGDGELLVRGPQVFAGYWGDPEATAEVLADGWLHTGDLAEIDGDGFVRITGRRQEILVTSGGKTVAPVMLEDRIRAHPLVAQCVVVGDGKPYLGALVTLDRPAVTRWLREHGAKESAGGSHEDETVHAEIARAIEAANTAVSQAEAVRSFRILGEVWSEETGELTPTQKVRRSLVLQRHHAEVESLFP